MKIIKTSLLAIAVFMGSLCFAKAQTIDFTYDDSGNRTSRVLHIEGLGQGESKSGLQSESDSEIKAVDFESGETSIIIYPNPSRGILNVEILNMPSEAKTELSIYNLSGTRLLIKKDFGTPSEVDISRFRDGVYIMRIKIDKIVSEWKIIKSN